MLTVSMQQQGEYKIPPDSLLYTVYGNLQVATLIRASLSESHTSMTALRMCVHVSPLAWPYTVNFK